MTYYQSGYRMERKIRKHLEAKGYFIIRSAGSHGPVDLVAFSPNTFNQPMFIQCKYTSDKDLMHVTGLQKTIDIAKKYGAEPVLGMSFGYSPFLILTPILTDTMTLIRSEYASKAVRV